jgi:hypothetical protein
MVYVSRRKTPALEWGEVPDVVGRPARLDVSHRRGAVEDDGHCDLIQKQMLDRL